MTAQICDQIIWQGKRYSLYCEPFLQYQLQHKDKARQFAFLHTTTANWRGYRARWEIKEDFCGSMLYRDGCGKNKESPSIIDCRK